MFYVLLILLVLLVTATYTWFSLSREPRVSDLAMYVNAPAGFELSADYRTGEWVQQLDFAECIPEHTVLKPVTWSDSQQQFFAAVYGFDGRLTGDWKPLTDEKNANREDREGYYTHGVIYAHSGTPVSVSLSPAVEIMEGLQGAGTFLISTPVWNTETIRHDSGGGGAEYAIRIGIRVQLLNQNGDPTTDPPQFYIYEPNCDGHPDLPEGYNAAEAAMTGYVPTPSIDETELLTAEDHLILQTSSDWTEADPVQRTAIIHNMGEFTTETKLFEIKPEQLAQLDIYVWLEGQDPDLTNAIGQEAQILANLQFQTDEGSFSGLVPIE